MEIERLTAYLRYLSTDGADLGRAPTREEFPPAWYPLLDELERFQMRVRDLLQLLERTLGKTSTKEALQVLQLQRLTGIIDGQNHDLQDLSRNAEELSQGVQRVAIDTSEAAQTADRMSALGSTSIERLQTMLALFQGFEATAQSASTGVEALAENSRQAAAGLKDIKGVASTSQLLAVNAAIQAAHANDRAFAVVAQEMRSLATRTNQLVKQIEGQVGRMDEAANVARTAVRRMADEAQQAGQQAGAAADDLQEIRGALVSLSGSVQSIAAVSQEQAAGTEAMHTAVRDLAGKVSAAAESLKLTRTQGISDAFEQVYAELGRFRIGAANEVMRATLDRMAQEVEATIEQAVTSGAVRLDDLWDTNYQELKGAAIQSLARLFDVTRVPATGFTPPKYSTSYDARIDLPLNGIMTTACEANQFIFGTVLDLNGFCLAQPRALVQDWTGNAESDLRGNRIKRLVTDPVSRKACRVGLPQALVTRDRVTRTDLERSGALTREPAAIRPFLLQTYALDTGAVVLAMATPVYVRGMRWGTVRIGYRAGE